MAERNIKKQGAHAGGEEAEAVAGWVEALIYVRTNPTKVAGGAGFLLLCIVVGGLFSLKNMTDERRENTEYAAARETEDPELRATELEKIANQSSRWSVDALYQLGEVSIEAKAYSKAREAFEKVLAQHGDSEYAPMAADGLAFLDENEGKLEEALQGYIGVFEKWDDTFTGRRQPYNIGRVQEGLGNHAEAIVRYEKQVEIFPESSVARKSEAALARMKAAMPELFPEEAKEEDGAVAAVSEVAEPEASDVAQPDTAASTEVASDEAPAATESTESSDVAEAPAESTEEAPSEDTAATSEPAEVTEEAPSEDTAATAAPTEETDVAPTETPTAGAPATENAEN